MDPSAWMERLQQGAREALEIWAEEHGGSGGALA